MAHPFGVPDWALLLILVSCFLLPLASSSGLRRYLLEPLATLFSTVARTVGFFVGITSLIVVIGLAIVAWEKTGLGNATRVEQREARERGKLCGLIFVLAIVAGCSLLPRSDPAPSSTPAASQSHQLLLSFCILLTLVVFLARYGAGTRSRRGLMGQKRSLASPSVFRSGEAVGNK
jgi:hypothetical protein